MSANRGLSEYLLELATDFSGATEATVAACVTHIADRYEMPADEVQACLEGCPDLLGMLVSPIGWTVLGDRAALTCGTTAYLAAERGPTIH
jgi:hypothetical protein